MKNILRTTGWLLCALCMASCGGGGSPYVASTSASCRLALEYANGATSGIAISESSGWNPLVNEVARTLTGCNIERLQSLQMDLCLIHPDTDSLEARLSGPGGTSYTVALTGVSSAADSQCSALEGSARLMRVPASIAAFSGLDPLDGSWRVQLRDRLSGFGSGTLVGWALQFEGLKW